MFSNFLDIVAINLKNTVLRKTHLNVKVSITQRALLAPFCVCIFLTTSNIKKFLLRTYSRNVIEAIYAKMCFFSPITHDDPLKQTDVDRQFLVFMIKNSLLAALSTNFQNKFL